jgi:hypothetical protein
MLWDLFPFLRRHTDATGRIFSEIPHNGLEESSGMIIKEEMIVTKIHFLCFNHLIN